MRAGGQSVADIELLRLGARTGQWVLEAIEDEYALFRVGDGIARLPISRGNS